MPELHPWLAGPEALEAVRAAVRKTITKMGGKALIIGAAELHSQALVILTECALPPRERLRTLCAQCGASLEDVRAGAKFCSPKCRKDHDYRRKLGTAQTLPASPQGHIGSMWKWPEGSRLQWAASEVSFVLNNYLRSRRDTAETPMSEALANFDAPAEERDEDAYEYLTRWLENHGVTVTGEEVFEELAEAAKHVLGETIAQAPEALAA